MNDANPIPQAVLDLVTQRAEDWKALFYWAVGGLALSVGSMAIYIKGVLSDLSISKAEAAKGDLAQAESNKAVASALEKLAEAVRHGRG